MDCSVSEFVWINSIPEVQARDSMILAKVGEEMAIIIISPARVIIVVTEITVFSIADENWFIN
jgi:hypothetical protein